ncbi:MAG: clostripain-related cysteine peptidase [Tannerellaceae bacterium]|nr:clostripain-related cysteine peptidase [Tannerellaceae bacterium]
MKRSFIYCLSLVFLLLSCEKNEEERIPQPDKKTEGKFDRTVLLYLVGDNSLHGDARNNINSIKNATKAADLYNNNFVIYADIKGQDPYLLDIRKYDDGEILIDTMHVYNDRNSASVESLQDIIAQVQEEYPSEKFGLILWGHATNWLPAKWFSDARSAQTMHFQTIEEPSFIRQLPYWDIPTKAYGDDDGRWMTVNDLQEALPDNLFDYILFDCCYMAGVEVMYGLKDKVDYIIASSAEILAAGFPYSEVAPLLLASGPDYKAICEAYYNHYNEQTGARQSGTISLVKTSGLDNLAMNVKNIFNNYQGDLAIPLTGLQTFDRQYTPKVMYDMGNYIEQFGPDDTFKDALNKVILYEAATEWMLRGEYGNFQINEHSGLTIFPYHTLEYLSISEQYKDLDWYKAVYE